MTDERILVWGAGAIGGTVGAYLKRAGHAVTFVDVVPEHVAAIRGPGLRIRGPVKDFTVQAPALLPGEVAGTEMAAVDLRDRAAGAAWIAGIEQAAGAPVGVLVNNADGVAGQVFQPIEQVADAAWDEILAINLGAAFALSRAAAPGMKRAGRGRIVNISSGAGLQASLTGIQAYASAKHAVVGLTRQLAHELGPHGITVNSVAPGLIPSNPASAAQWESYGPARQAAMLGGIALRRLGTPGDIAGAVLFFASPLADFVNGQILQADGGK